MCRSRPTERLFNKFAKHLIPKGTNVVTKLLNKIYSRISIEEKFKRVIRTYIKQRIIIRMKYFNYNNQLIKQKRKYKIQFQKLNKLRKIVT